MRRFALCGGLVVALAAASPAGAQVPRHVHSVTTPGGPHEIGRGVSFNAPCVAFLNLHQNVHLGAFAGTNPNTISVEFISGSC
jgi:hypothetical protein